MFNNRQEEVKKMLSENIEFRRIYNKHQQLDQQVHDAEVGTLPIDDLSLTQMKKEKLYAKDRLARMLDQSVLS